jgi:hypothetical protein
VTQVFGVVSEFRPEDDTTGGPTIFYLAPFSIVEVRRDEAHRPPGTCFMQVVFAPDVPISALGLEAGQQLWIGGDARAEADVTALFPFRCGPFHGFADLRTDRIVGDGAFFLSLSEAKASVKYPGAEFINLVSPP